MRTFGLGLAIALIFSTFSAGLASAADKAPDVPKELRAKGMAAAPALIPYRMTLEVPGYGTALVDDTGGAMRQDAVRHVVHLDLRFVTHAEALRWGRRWMWISLPADGPAAQVETLHEAGR